MRLLSKTTLLAALVLVASYGAPTGADNDIFTRGANGYDGGVPAGIINGHDLIQHSEFYNGNQQNPFNMVAIFAAHRTIGDALEFVVDGYQPGHRPTPPPFIPPPPPPPIWTNHGGNNPHCSPWANCGHNPPPPPPTDDCTHTPEPSTVAMLAISGIGLGVTRVFTQFTRKRSSGDKGSDNAHITA